MRGGLSRDTKELVVVAVVSSSGSSISIRDQRSLEVVVRLR
jgi:hypothetical protein